MKYNYRPDIDGIRAISVLLVLFFHAGIFGIKAGFIGVDIFFVISGFLITTGIKNSLENGNFSFIQFFKKRLWRLQPVFIALLLVTTIITALTYLPNDFLKFTDSAKWVARFQSNRYFAGLDVGYFADDTSIMPLLHTWSLSIEWQWYLVLPFLMFGFYKILRVEKLDYWVFPLTIVMIGVAFYTLGDRTNPHYYYSFLARIFEMLIGSCLAAVGTRGIDKIPESLKTIIGGVCLGFIAYTAFDSSVIYQYPNWWAVGVCIAGALLIYIGGGTKNNLITHFLSFKPLVFIGVISYSLYIWHWPVFAFIRNLGINETWFVTSIALITSFAMACLSFYFVENKFRKLHTISLGKTLLILVAIPYLIIVTVDWQNKKNDGFVGRFENLAAINKINEASKPITDIRINCWQESDHTKCSFGDTSSNIKTILIGDSFSNHAIGTIDVIAKNANISVTAEAYPECLAFFDFDEIYLFGGSKNNKCIEANKRNYRDITQGKYDFVIIGEVWSRYLNNEPSRAKALDRSIKIIEESGATPVLINSIYDVRISSDVENYSACFYQNIKSHNTIKNSCILEDKSKNNEKVLFVDELFNELQDKYPSLKVIDITDVQCQDGVCSTSIDRYPVYIDKNGHTSDYASYLLGKQYLEKYGNPLK